MRAPKPKAGRSISSQRWLARQHKDPFVADAKAQGYRSRAAFKLAEIDDKFRLLGPGKRVLDLGAAPGGWTQVAVERVRPAPERGAVFAVDVAPMDPIAGATVLALDLSENAVIGALPARLGDLVDLVLSDMAPAASGNRTVDALRAATLAESALAIAELVLRPGGAFVAKVMRSGQETAFVAALKERFESVRTFKPKASRQDSAEIYAVATDFRG
ncbi:MAG: RlmE family RNA methyltransferase [Alphaproteobacteria bacterium]|nr:RlmE family RNA methyltransferase [Alphaproteobacteria bacterium]